MKVLVTGATGFLGANVVENLTANGYAVNVLVRKTSNILGLEGLFPDIHIGELEDQGSLITAAKDCNAIVHCAANTKQWNTSREEHDRINLEGTKNILKAGRMAGAEKVVFVSTANTFPLMHRTQLTLNSDYIASKQAAEEYMLTQQELPTVVINPSFMIGARDVKPSSGQAILHYLNHNPVFTPAGGKSFIHVQDVATAIRKSLEMDVKGERFLMANDNRSYRSFFKLIGKLTGKKKKLVVIPKAISRIGGSLGSYYGELTGASPKLTRENATIINNNLFYDGETSYRKLDIKKRSLEEAIQEALYWFKTNGYCN